MLSAEEIDLYNKLEDQINSICNSLSSKCADVCRQIIFALFLVIGAFSFKEGQFSPNIFLLLSLVFLIIYLVLDVGRYFYSTRSFHRFRNEINLSKKTGGSSFACGNKIKEQSDKIARFTYRLFAVQIWGCLLLAFVSLVIGIWGVMFVEC